MTTSNHARRSLGRTTAPTRLDSGPLLTAHDGRTLRQLLAEDRISSVYQPIVELDSGVTVGFEALVAGYPGTQLATPKALFDEARRLGLLPELDMACRTAALDGARASGMHRLWTLFVNTEPNTAASAFGPSAVGDPPRSAVGDMGVVVELTERSLVDNPVELLQLVARIRAQGWGIALDDVGTSRASLALLPLLRPDVIKLDMRLIHSRASEDVVEIVGAANAEAERSGSVVLAEGIETPVHLDAARALGATHGQGWLFGQPGPLPDRLPPFTGSRIELADRSTPGYHGTPFEFGTRTVRPRLGDKLLLTEFSKHLEGQALRAGGTALLLATFQNASLFTRATRRRYAALAQRVAFVGVLGEDVGMTPLPGVRGGLLGPHDPLVDEWNVAVVTPHFAASLVARDRGPDGPDPDRRFTFAFSYDRELAIAVATYLMSRISPLTSGPDSSAR